MWYSASNPLRRKFHFSALCHGDDGVVGRVVVCGWVSSSVFFWRWRRNHTPRAGPRQPSLYSTCFLKIGHFTFLGCGSNFFIFSQKRKGKRNSSIVYIDSYARCLHGGADICWRDQIHTYLLAWPDICTDTICRYLQISAIYEGNAAAYNQLIRFFFVFFFLQICHM